MRRWLVVALCLLVIAAVGIAVAQQMAAGRQQAAAQPEQLRVLAFSIPVEGEPSIFLRRLQADPRSLEVTAVGPEAPATLDQAAYDLFVVDNYLPPDPVVEQVLRAVRQGKGLLFRASLDYGPVVEGDAARLESLEVALPVHLARKGLQSEAVAPRPGTILIPIGVEPGELEHPLVREIGWRSAPSVPEVALTPLRDPAAQVLVRELRTAERNPVLTLGSYGQGQILVLSLPVEGTVNEYLRNWPYFKYLLYLGLRTLGDASYEPYGTWVGSPETLTPAVRAVLLSVLGGLVLITLGWITWAWRHSRRGRLRLHRPVSPDLIGEDRARLGMWERAGFHKALSGHMFYLTVNLVTSVFVILTMLYFLPSFVTPDPSVMGLDYLAASLFSLVFALADFGSFSALGRFLGEHNVKDPERTVKYVQILITFQLITGLVQTTFIWLFAIYALPVTRQFSFMAWSFVLKGLIQWPGMLWVFKDTLNGLQKYDYAVWIVTGNYVLEWITWVGCIALFRALFGDMLTDPIASQLGASVGAYIDDIVTTFFSLYLLGRVQKAWRTTDCFRMDFGRAQLRETLVFGGKVLLAGLSVLAVNMAVTLLQLNTVYNYLYVAAFVGLAAQTRLQVPQQGQIILDNLYAPIAEAFNNGKRALSRYYVSQGLKWFATSTVPLYLVSIVLLPPLLRDILPPVYQDVAWMVLVLTVVMPLLPLDLLMKTVLLGADRAGVFSWATLGEQVLRVAVFAALLPVVGPAAQMWVLLLGDSPAKLLKVAGLWTWIHRRLLPIRVHVFQTLVAPLLAGAGYLGLCAMLMLLVRRASLVGQVALSALDVGLVAALGLLIARRRFATRPAVMQSRAFGLALLGVSLAALLVLVWMGDELYYVSLIMTLVVFFPPVAYFPLLGLLGGWDRHGLEQFGLAADGAGLAYALYYPAYQLTAKLCQASPLFNRYPIPHAEAQAEALELDRLRLERTYTAPPAPRDGA